MIAHSSRTKSGPANGRGPLEGIERHQLANGLTLLTRQDHSVPIVSTMIWYRVGARAETPGTTGISHFLEHMMFKGSRLYEKGEIDYLTACQGGSNNAFTSHDYTAYYFSFASDRWRLALEIEADRMVHNRFDADELELERQVILEELRMELDNPWGALRRELDRRSFATHPYGHPIIGDSRDVRSITRRQLMEHYHLYYAPNNAVLVVAGDFSRRQLVEEVSELFDPIPRASITTPEIEPEVFENGPDRFQLEKPSPVSRLLIGVTAPSAQQPEFHAFNVIDQVLSQGVLSRLHRRLVEEERIASWVETEFSPTLDPYLFLISAELHPGQKLQRAEAAIFQELERLGSQPLSTNELKRAKNQCLADFFAECETTLDQATQLGLAEILDLPSHWSDFVSNIQGLEPENIQRVAAGLLLPERSTIGALPCESE